MRNLGISSIGETRKTAKTIIVVGVARGGTSACAGALHELGISTGPTSRPPFYEDIALSAAIESKNFDEAKKRINYYNQLYPIWAFKRPSAINHLDFLLENTKKPLFVFVFRDIFAISNRTPDQSLPGVTSNLRESQNHYEKIIEFIERRQPRAVLVSYEKLLYNKEIFVEYIIKESQIPPPDVELKKKASSFVKPEPNTYVSQTSFGEYHGHIDSITSTTISGWAVQSTTGSPISVSIRINNKTIATVKATLKREDVRIAGLSSNELCGFTWSPPEPLSDAELSQLTVHFENTSRQLPRPFQTHRTT